MNGHYQYLGNVMSWNIIKVQNGFVDLELVIKISLQYKNILFRTKNDVCSSFGLSPISPSNLVKKIIKHKNIKAKIFSESTLDNFSKKVLDIKKVCNTFKWKPMIKISRNIQKIL